MLSVMVWRNWAARYVDVNTNGQVVIRDSAINEGFNTAKPWADAAISNRPFAGNTGSVDDNDEIQRNLNDTNDNRMWIITAAWVVKWLQRRRSKSN